MTTNPKTSFKEEWRMQQEKAMKISGEVRLYI
jgi:hypothetical protein